MGRKESTHLKILRGPALGAFFLAAMFCHGQNADVIHIRIQEQVSAGGYSYMTISGSDSTSTTIDLKKLKIDGTAAPENGIAIAKALVDKGYTITSSSISGNEILTTTLIILTRSDNK